MMANEQSYSIGVDIGGTFTDCAVVGADGDVFTGKVPTTPDDRSRCFFDAIEAAANRRGMSLAELLAVTERLAHGTTAGINALVTRQGAPTGLLATTGHGDAIRIMDNTGRVTGAPVADLLDYAASDLPEQYLPRSWIREVTERIDATGAVVTPLDTGQLLGEVDRLVAQGVRAVAVAFLWSHVNPEHEERAARLIRQAHPNLYVSCSHEVAPRMGEYPRTASVLMNAYLGPLMHTYTTRIEDGARAAGFTGEIVFATVEGGLVDPETVRRLPITTVQSGPVGGVLGCATLGDRMGYRNVITTDMGGTSLDASVVEDGRPVSGDEAVIERHHLYLRRIDVESIGAGGGSIAWCDETTGTVRVGPQSAGATPGPVCYGRGGTEPTVTDADLVLGFLDPDRGLAGGVPLDIDAARAALERLGAKVGLDAVATAAGIVRIVDNRMEDLLRRVTLQKGHDPRDFSVWAFGGAAGLHAGLYAGSLGVRSIVVPVATLASVWSAYGIALSEFRRTFQEPAYLDTPLDGSELAAGFAKLEGQARQFAARVLPAGTDYELVRKVEMKYAMQWYSVELESPPGPYGEDYVARLLADFERTYERRYGAGAGYSEAGISVTTLGVTMRAPRPPVLAVRETVAGQEVPPRSQRPIHWLERGDFVPTPVYAGADLLPGAAVTGPALIEFPDTSVAVRPGQRAAVDEYTNIVLTGEPS